MRATSIVVVVAVVVGDVAGVGDGRRECVGVGRLDAYREVEPTAYGQQMFSFATGGCRFEVPFLSRVSMFSRNSEHVHEDHSSKDHLKKKDKFE